MDSKKKEEILFLAEKLRVLLKNCEKADQAVEDANIRVDELRNEKDNLLKEIRLITTGECINVKIENILYEIRPNKSDIESVCISETPIDIEE